MRTGVNHPGRAYWRPSNDTSRLYYSAAAANELLAKRSYLLSHLGSVSGKDFRPDALQPVAGSVKLSDALLAELRNTTQVSSSHWASEWLRRSSNVPSTMPYAGGFLSNAPVSSSRLISQSSEYLINSALNSSYLVRSSGNWRLETGALHKSQYRPMKKGISNMIRLHATGAVAMPTETRLHIMASSRDIIHSWAVPAAGIKIDCVPGFTSHRVTSFLVHGIYWGQCMEVCGRFHH
jgi:hypothetical protein